MQFLESVDSELRLSASRLRHTVDPLLLAPQEVSCLGHLSLAGVHSLLALLEVVGIVAVVGENMVIVKLENASADAVEEITVVRDHEERGRRAAEILLEPLNNLDIEVVSGLVENKKVGLGKQKVGNSDTLSLSSGELAHLLVEVSDIEATEHLLSSAFIVPGLKCVHLLDERGNRVVVMPCNGRLVVPD